MASFLVVINYATYSGAYPTENGIRAPIGTRPNDGRSSGQTMEDPAVLAQRLDNAAMQGFLKIGA